MANFFFARKNIIGTGISFNLAINFVSFVTTVPLVFFANSTIESSPFSSQTSTASNFSINFQEAFAFIFLLPAPFFDKNSNSLTIGSGITT